MGNVLITRLKTNYKQNGIISKAQTEMDPIWRNLPSLVVDLIMDTTCQIKFSELFAASEEYININGSSIEQICPLHSNSQNNSLKEDLDYFYRSGRRDQFLIAKIALFDNNLYNFIKETNIWEFINLTKNPHLINDLIYKNTKFEKKGNF
jgi:hypothetical protein